MRKSRFSEEQIAMALRQGEADASSPRHSLGTIL